MLLANDIQFHVGLHGIPLFPVLAGYGTGLLVQTGMTVQLALVSVLLSSKTQSQLFLLETCFCEENTFFRPFSLTFTFTWRLQLQCPFFIGIKL